MPLNINPFVDPFNCVRAAGKVSFSVDIILEVNLVIRLLYSGKIKGKIDFLTYSPYLLEYAKNLAKFTIQGKTEDGTDFFAEDCILTNIHENLSHSSASGEFSSFKVVFYPDSLKLKPTRRLRIDFALLNVYRMLLIDFMTNSGNFVINQYTNYEQLEKVMSTYHVPMITSCGTLSFIPDGSKTLEEIINIITADVRDFLRVTSLSQTTWHDWASIEVSKQIENSEMAKTIWHMWRSPKIKPPHYRQLAMAVNSREFIKSAWKGYSHDNDKYGFDFALEWYIESNSAWLDVTKFVNATTCLELLMSKFNSLKLTKPSAEEIKVKSLYKSVRKSISAFLKSKGVPNDLISKICQMVIKKSTYLENAKTLLDFWGISVSDIKTSLADIVTIRNDIIHRGLHFHDEDAVRAMRVLDASEDLFQILTRIFLAMLKFEDEYYDPPRNRWIKFSDVCKSWAPRI